MHKTGQQLESQRPLGDEYASREDAFVAATASDGKIAALVADGREWLLEHFAYNRRTARSTAISVAVHLVALLVIAQWRLPERVATEVPDLNHVSVQPDERFDAEFELAEAADNVSETVWSTAALAVAPNVSDDIPELVDEMPLVDSPEADIRLTRIEPLSAVALDDVRTQLGSVGSEVVAVSGAVDQITHEIVMNLEQSDVLVVWLMDASISLKDDRRQIAKRLERVYDEIDTIAAEGTLHPDALSGAVFSFGRQTKELVAPTEEGKKIVEAIREKVPIDDSGVENVFAAVTAAATQYRALSTRGKRKMMFVVWTDESGDDVVGLEQAANICQRLGAVGLHRGAIVDVRS